jgi:predicted oxidoreductase
MPLALDQQIGALVWSPLGWGRLTGRIRRGQPLPAHSRLHTTADYGPPIDDQHLYTVVDALDEAAQETGHSVPQVALNWLLQQPTVFSVIIGGTQRDAATRQPRRRRLDADRRPPGTPRRRQPSDRPVPALPLPPAGRLRPTQPAVKHRVA